ncbi:imidazole glycerol phosphate synthase, glutamine amidotransferase subunit [Methylocella silvestris BL2]|uniref:Imidazole glycerol phosphate synthase subunit HisH n=1 Tax=Methylocella silvestris (strain DSM 15510 / CIP 108128 / LMG 27833 / NCIMB 13906 / BL2) TaxID=395965 RepID=B8EM87_METSB|nr:imidazole glycerol phosphate synthase subunit HisH [Methylocella silvestris]ACK51476.1 imidazole glycerol phosphate synthase, glutamine amidotransferase subunit [Methylocella silvestris BL2]
MKIAIVDYGSGNLHSAHKAFERAAREAGITASIRVTPDPGEISRADQIVLPGVGAFADCRRGLDEISGMVEALNEAVLKKGRPFFGICVGMQLLATRGLEHGETAGLGWIEGEVDAMAPGDASLRIPHMGWNTLLPAREHPALRDIPTGENGLHAYFVHSYEFRPAQAASVIASTDYGGKVAALIGRDNILGSQFHPEKSQSLGLALIANFLRWRP